MGQQEVFTFLQENRRKWFTAKQIAERLKVSFGSVITSLKILRQSKQIKFKMIKVNALRKKKVFVYKFKK